MSIEIFSGITVNLTNASTTQLFDDAKGEEKKKSSLDYIPLLSSLPLYSISFIGSQSVSSISHKEHRRPSNQRRETRDERGRKRWSSLFRAESQEERNPFDPIFCLLKIFIMRRHSLDPESIRKQLISMFTPSRKRQQSSNNHLTVNFGRRMRRFSVPEKPSRDPQPISEVCTKSSLVLLWLRAFCFERLVIEVKSMNNLTEEFALSLSLFFLANACARSLSFLHSLLEKFSFFFLYFFPLMKASNDDDEENDNRMSVRKDLVASERHDCQHINIWGRKIQPKRRRPKKKKTKTKKTTTFRLSITRCSKFFDEWGSTKYSLHTCSNLRFYRQCSRASIFHARSTRSRNDLRGNEMRSSLSHESRKSRGEKSTTQSLAWLIAFFSVDLDRWSFVMQFLSS